MNLLPESISTLDILSQLTDAVIAIDLDGRILFWNEGAQRLYGWTSEQALGESANELLKTRSSEPLELLVDSLLREGRWEGELTRYRLSGEPIDVLSRWSLIRDQSGTPTARVLIDSDLTETRLRFHELRLAEERARENEAATANRESLLSCLLDGISDCAYLKDPQGRYLAVNAAAAHLIGKPAAEIIGKSDFDLFPREKAQALLDQDARILASGEPCSFEEELPGPDGLETFHTIKSVCRGPERQVIGLVGLSRDLRERKQLEEKLRRRERDLTEAHRIAGIGTWHWDRASDTVTWSDEIYRIYGLDRSSTPPSFSQICAKPNATPSEKQFMDAFRRAFLFGEPYELDIEVKAADGTSRWIVARAAVDTWRDGEVTGLRGTVIEITERKLLEIALQERERQLSEAHRIAKLGTWRYDCVTGETTWSEEIYRIYGMDPAQKAMQFGDFLKRPHHTENEKLFIAAFQRTLTLGDPFELDIEVVLADGSKRWTASRGEVDQWIDGKVAAVRGTVHEITERKRQEEQLALSENRYRSLVHASTQIVWTTNPEGGQMHRLPEWQAFTGQSDSEVLGYGWADAIHPEDRATTIELWQEAVRTVRTFTLEHRLRRHDGLYRDMSVRAAPVMDRAGAVVEWVGTHTDITEQKQAQKELQEAHQRLQNVMDSITDGLAIMDRDLRYTFYNKNGARALGLRPEDIVGKKLGDLFPHNRTNIVGAEYRRALETGEPRHFEVNLDPPLEMWAEIHCYPSAQGLTIYYRDITDRRRSEAALRASEARFRKLFESDLMGIGIPDRFGAFKEGNNELLRMTGYTREELDAGLVRWDRMTPPEYAHLDATHIAEAAERGSCTPYEKEYIRKDGSRVPILCGYVLLEGSDDEYLGFVLDISRQRAAEAALREREQRFRLLAESLPELVWMTDRIGTLTYLNTRFLDYCGIPAEQMAGFDWRSILHPDEADRVNREWAHAVTTGEPYLIELRMKAKDGTFRHFLARALALRNEQGEVERWVGSCTDVHDQKLAEEALRRSEKLAATGRLAASIAHEINNPLSSVMNSLYLALQDDALNDETRGFLKVAEQELTRVTHITTQTLRFHKQSKACSVADLADTMRSVLMLFGPRLLARRIDVTQQLRPGSQLRCFDDELRQVFANLVSNALDATADGGRLLVRVRPTRHGGAAGIRVTVADTGNGIPKSALPRIFEPFFSTKDATGIGLGLWVSEGIIRKHRGRLALRSTTDPVRHGTVFTLFFPLDGLAAAPEGSGVAPRLSV